MERQFGFSSAITAQCGYWVVPPRVSVCVCGGINSTKIKTIDNWESKQCWNIGLTEGLFSPASVIILHMLTTGREQQPWYLTNIGPAIHLPDGQNEQRRTCRPHACTMRSFCYKRHTPQHLFNMLSSSGKAIIPCNYVANPRTRTFSHKAYTTTQDKICTVCSRTTHRNMEPWPWGYGKTDSWCFWSMWASEKPHS